VAIGSKYDVGESFSEIEPDAPGSAVKQDSYPKIPRDTRSDHG
jgi:hypothetical protein